MTAVEKLMGDESEGPLRMLPVMRYAEKKTAFDKGKGRKTESVISVKEDIPDDDVIAHLSSSEKQPPRLIVFLNENKLTGCFIATDKVHIQCENDISSALLQLLSAYYVFNLEYPKTYSQLLGLFQALVLHDPYMGNKSAKYKTYETLLLRHLKSMDTMEIE